jgi:hypothetical protein
VGNPISNAVDFIAATGDFLYEEGFPSADPFWIVYPHPNKMVSRGNHIAKIWNTQIDDFVSAGGGWQEWSYRKENRLSDMLAWAEDLQSTITPLNITGDVTEPCSNGTIVSCPNGPYYTESNDFKYALLEYDENSEFRKITARAFFNMPQGQEFDCRDERFTNVAVPSISIVTPAEGLIANNPHVPEGTDPSDYDFFRVLPVTFTIENEGNLSYYKAKEIKVYLDNRLAITLSTNHRETVLLGVQDGRHTIKMDILDNQGRLIPGTRKIHLFGYEFLPPESP